MLARILFNLTFLFSMVMAVMSSVKLGIAYAMPVALLTFCIGMLFCFVIGILKGASSISYE